MPEPEIVNRLRRDFFWRLAYAVFAVVVAVYVLFDILDLDGSNRRVSQSAPKGTLWVADAASEADSLLPPDLPARRAGNGDDPGDLLFAATCFPASTGLIIAVLALSRRHRYRVALPRSSVSDPPLG